MLWSSILTNQLLLKDFLQLSNLELALMPEPLNTCQGVYFQCHKLVVVYVLGVLIQSLLACQFERMRVTF